MRGDLSRFPMAVLAASVAVLSTALLSQYWGGLTPCELCLLQRWPWVAAIAISLVSTLAGSRRLMPWVALLLTTAFVVGSGLALFHVGVEKHWFAGPAACTGGSTAADTVEALKARILGQMPARCDEAAWSLWGISMAGWNLLASLIMAAACLAVFLKLRQPRRSGMRQGIA